MKVGGLLDSLTTAELGRGFLSFFFFHFSLPTKILHYPRNIDKTRYTNQTFPEKNFFFKITLIHF